MSTDFHIGDTVTWKRYPGQEFTIQNKYGQDSYWVRNVQTMGLRVALAANLSLAVEREMVPLVAKDKS